MFSVVVELEVNWCVTGSPKNETDLLVLGCVPQTIRNAVLVDRGLNPGKEQTVAPALAEADDAQSCQIHLCSR